MSRSAPLVIATQHSKVNSETDTCISKESFHESLDKAAGITISSSLTTFLARHRNALLQKMSLSWYIDAYDSTTHSEYFIPSVGLSV